MYFAVDAKPKSVRLDVEMNEGRACSRSVDARRDSLCLVCLRGEREKEAPSDQIRAGGSASGVSTSTRLDSALLPWTRQLESGLGSV